MLHLVSSIKEPYNERLLKILDKFHLDIINQMDLDAWNILQVFEYRDFYHLNSQGQNTLQVVEKYGTPFIKCRCEKHFKQKQQLSTRYRVIEGGKRNEYELKFNF